MFSLSSAPSVESLNYRRAKQFSFGSSPFLPLSLHFEVLKCSKRLFWKINLLFVLV